MAGARAIPLREGLLRAGWIPCPAVYRHRPHTVLVMAAAAICAITAALHKPGTGAQAPLAVRPG